MEDARLPIELVSVTLRHLIRSYEPLKIGKVLDLRLISKAVNDEVQRLLFIEAHIDVRAHNPSYCLECHRIIRAERLNKAVNKITCLRYLVALFGARDLPKWDMRIKQWSVMKRAVQELETVPGFVENITTGAARLSTEACTALAFVTPRGNIAERQFIVSRALADAIATLLGIRNAWADFGPHHDSCGSQRWAKPRTVFFWKVVIASHVGNVEAVRDILKLVPSRDLGERLAGPRKSSSGPDDYRHNVEYLQNPEYIADYLAAALTVAIRQGHQKVVDLLFSCPGAETELVLITRKYFNNGSVLGAAVNATNHNNEIVARFASQTVDRILNLWHNFSPAATDRAHQEKLLMSISKTAPNNLFQKAVGRIFTDRKAPELTEEVLLESVLVGNAERVKFILNYIEQPNSSRSYRYRSFDWANEYGVGIDRVILDGNIFKIAAVNNHVEVLRALRDYSPILDWAGPGGTSLTKDKVRSMKQWRGRENYGEFLSPIRRAVNDVFIDNDRLPGKKFRNPASLETLGALLDIAPTDLSWGAETVACAGLSRPEYLQELLKRVDLDDEFPDKYEGRIESRLDGAKAITIGERALQHALRNLKPDNVDLLLKHGAKLAESIRLANPIFEIDDDRMRERERLHEILRSHASSRQGTRIVCTSRQLQVDYFASDGKESVSAEDVENIERDNKHFHWQVGLKSRGRGRPTTFLPMTGDQ